MTEFDVLFRSNCWSTCMGSLHLGAFGFITGTYLFAGFALKFYALTQVCRAACVQRLCPAVLPYLGTVYLIRLVQH